MVWKTVLLVAVFGRQLLVYGRSLRDVAPKQFENNSDKFTNSTHNQLKNEPLQLRSFRRTPFLHFNGSAEKEGKIRFKNVLTLT